MTEPFIVQAGSGRLLDLGNFQAEILATAEQTANAFSLLLTQAEPPGFGPPLHRHHDADEAFFVLAGEYIMDLGDRRERCPAGTFVYLPRGQAHTFEVVSTEPGRKLNLFTPSAMVGFFEDLAAAEADGAATRDVLGQIAERHGVEVLGAVPDTYL